MPFSSLDSSREQTASACLSTQHTVQWNRLLERNALCNRSKPRGTQSDPHCSSLLQREGRDSYHFKWMWFKSAKPRGTRVKVSLSQSIAEFTCFLCSLVNPILSTLQGCKASAHYPFDCIFFKLVKWASKSTRVHIKLIRKLEIELFSYRIRSNDFTAESVHFVSRHFFPPSFSSKKKSQESLERTYGFDQTVF